MKKKILSMLTIFVFLMCTIPIFSAAYTLVLSGQRTVYIPDSGSTLFSYSAVVIDADGIAQSTNGKVSVVGTLPEGVSFNDATFELKVNESAPVGTTIELKCTPDESFNNLKPVSFYISLTKDLCINGNFKDYPKGSGWDKLSSSPFEISDGSVLINPANDVSNYTYTLVQENPLNLLGGKMYVVRAKVKSTSEYPDSNVYAYNVTNVVNGVAEANIFDIGGSEWTEVFSAFRPTADGIYEIQLKLHAVDERPIYIKDVSIAVETPVASTINISAPSSFNIPKTPSFSFPFSIDILDQCGNLMENEGYDISLSPSNTGVSIDKETMTITALSTAIGGDYTMNVVCSSNPLISKKFIFNVTPLGIDDGSFEKKGVGYAWMPIEPSVLSIISGVWGNFYKQGANKYARFDLKSDFGVMYNNSYVSFEKEISYIFEAEFSKKFSNVGTHITFFIQPLDTSKELILAAYFEVDNNQTLKKAIYTPDESVVGRLFIAVNTDDGFDEQVVFIDNVAVDLAYVTAKNVSIVGKNTLGSTIKGSYKFVNNFDSENASVTRWLISDLIDGPYRQLGITNEAEIELTENMLGKYIKFEVTPLSLTSGLIGETIVSDAIRVMPKNSGSWTYTPPASPDDETKTEKDPQIMQAVNLDGLSTTNILFDDIKGHWAQNEILLMAASGVATGYNKKEFRPNNTVSRAEFSAFLMRSVSLNGGIYKGRFIDVSPESWYAGVVQTVFDYNLTYGVSDNLFAPNINVTREQAVVMLMRAYEKIKGSVAHQSPINFNDKADISSYAVSAIGKAFELKIINGTNENSFEPKRTTTRAEALVMLYRMILALK